MKVLDENQEELTVEEMAKRWLELRNVAENATKEAEILKIEIESRSKEFKIPGAEVILTSKGTYDWEKIAMKMKPAPADITRFTIVEWKKLAEAIAPSKKILADWQAKYWSGKSFYQLRITKE